MSNEYRRLHDSKLLNFLGKIIDRLSQSLREKQRKTLKILHRIDHPYIGGGLLIQKNPIDEIKPSEEGPSYHKSEVSKIDALAKKYDILMEEER